MKKIKNIISELEEARMLKWEMYGVKWNEDDEIFFLTSALNNRDEEWLKIIKEIANKQYAGRADKDSPVWIERDVFLDDLIKISKE